eukprot:TRINITY_DN57100_c0_g1_i1.p1 TRINITY_DN57100_c0_g1~~TRINITY_DN57100_c0_g1_i1.p1  ORF type:complete len:840 (-),score=121.37 TRINITY_DN57100_c0_g1_i1:84-2603(-)
MEAELTSAIAAVVAIEPSEDRHECRSREAFEQLRVVVTHLAGARARGDEAACTLMATMPEKERLLKFVVETAMRARIFKSQAVSILLAVLQGSVAAGWLEVAQADPELLGRLKDVDARIAELFPGPPQPKQTATSADSIADDARQANGSRQSGTDAANHAEQNRNAQASVNGNVDSSSAVDVARVETRRMLRAGLEAMAALHFEVVERNLDVAMDAFHEFRRGVNRAHCELTRCRKSPTARDNLDEDDALTQAAIGLSWDPHRVIMFLFNLMKLRSIYRKQILAIAQILTQISPSCRDVARSDSFLAAWLGAGRGSNNQAHVVSYSFVSSLRWAAWNAGWHCVNLRRGYEKDAATDLEGWAANEQKALASCELPQPVIEGLLTAAWKAARHCAAQRFPKQKGSLFGGFMGILAGAQEDSSLDKDEFMKMFAELENNGALSDSLLFELKWMLWNMAWYTANKAVGYTRDACESLVKVERHMQRAYRTEGHWRGVNLGGWFLLEPGPCDDFWANLPPQAQATSCEWDCCEALDPAEAQRLLTEHRRTYFGKADFDQMRAAGVTHVRLPIGAWCIVGPQPGEPYVGPCLEALDRAIDLLEASGLRVLLDLHGCVGGESGEPPSGRKNEGWTPICWDPSASLLALSTLAERYAGRICICGICVANEPAESIPGEDLARYYISAVREIRRAGMRAGEVAVLLPVFPENRLLEFLGLWEKYYSKFDDCVFDFHFYQCFGCGWGCMSLDVHIQQATKRRAVLERAPSCCVSEWSVALPGEVELNSHVYSSFAEAQLEAYETATHGWFFWTWKDSAGLAWNFRDCLDQGILKMPEGGRKRASSFMDS